MDLPGFIFRRGALHLPAWRLWLDAHHAVGQGEAVFVSHAHADHTAAHAEIFTTEGTRRLMRARVRGERTEHVLGFGEQTDLRSLVLGGREAFLTLLPAGHVLGSAMSLLESGEGSLLYTGDFKLRPGLSSEVCEPRRADVLIMESTFGLPAYVFPPSAEVFAQVIRFCRETLDERSVPVLLGYSLGKAQEILRALAGAGLPVMMTEPVARITRVYQTLGVEFPEYQVLDVARATGHVVLAPPGGDTEGLRRRLERSRLGVLTGWALNPSCKYRYRADAVFPLSDHADYPDLLEMVRRVGPRVVYTMHGFAEEFAATLRRQGVEAWALGGRNQLEFRWEGDGGAANGK